jgi:hypothetical protein
MRPPQSTLERLRQRARLSGQPHTTLAERYLYEGLLMDENPGIRFVDDPMGRRPALIGFSELEEARWIAAQEAIGA